jgi:hypothetical protein
VIAMVTFNFKLKPFAYLQREIRAGEFVPPATLAAEIRQHAGHPIPPEVIEYVCRVLEGKVKRRRGRKPLSLFERRRIQMMVKALYLLFCEEVREEKREFTRRAQLTRRGRTQPIDKRSISEIAAELTARHYGMGPRSARTIQNIISARI